MISFPVAISPIYDIIIATSMGSFDLFRGANACFVVDGPDCQSIGGSRKAKAYEYHNVKEQNSQSCRNPGRT